MRNSFFIILFVIFFGSTMLFAKAPADYRQAKHLIMPLFATNNKTLYCGCKFNAKKIIDLNSCGMNEASKHKRAKRLEWEHMMPAENFGRQFRCWREPLCKKRNGKAFKGRKCCRAINSEFKKAEGELYNLWPSVGLVNQARSNYRFSPLPKKHGFYGCSIEIDKRLRKVAPPDRAKGIVARANLFMAERYHIKLSKAQRRLFNAWNKAFPPDVYELQWAQRVEQIEGYKNPFITNINEQALLDER